MGLFIHLSTGSARNVEFGISCVTIANAYNNSVSSRVLANAWNTANDNIQNKLNQRQVAPSTSILATELLLEVNRLLNIAQPGSVMTASICSGSVNGATANYNCN